MWPTATAAAEIDRGEVGEQMMQLLQLDNCRLPTDIQSRLVLQTGNLVEHPKVASVVVTTRMVLT